jgi:2-phosphoglycerate kinase
MGQPLVVLLGGSSGVGKSVLAAALARRLGLSLLIADDICLVLQRTTSPAALPLLHRFFAELPSSPLR